MNSLGVPKYNLGFHRNSLELSLWIPLNFPYGFLGIPENLVGPRVEPTSTHNARLRMPRRAEGRRGADGLAGRVVDHGEP